MKKNSIACALLVPLLMLSLPTGCGHVSSADKASSSARMLYQPPTLRLPAGQPVQTPDGVYIPQVAEVWHSDARFRRLEQENIDLALALFALRNK